MIIVALRKIAADLLNKGEMLCRFQAFNERFHVQLVADVNQLLENKAVETVSVVQVAQKLHIAFDQIEMEAAEHIDRGIFAAEIIQPKLVACFADAVKLRGKHVRV